MHRMREASAIRTCRPPASVMVVSAVNACTGMLSASAAASIHTRPRLERDRRMRYLSGLGISLSFGQDQLAVGCDAQTVVLAIVLQDRLALACQQLAHFEAARAAGVRGRPLAFRRWRIVLAHHGRSVPAMCCIEVSRVHLPRPSRTYS